MFLEYPTCTYYSMATPLKPEFAFGCTCFGYKRPFSKEELEKRYGTLDNYKKLVTAMAEKQVTEGLLEPADLGACIDTAIRFAKDGGLE